MRFFDCKAVVTYIMDDADWYRRALQRSLLTEGWEAAFDYDRLREWVQTNREVLRASARATLGDAASACMDEYQSVVESFFPRSEYDLPETEAIFRPLLDAVVDTARVIGLRLVREVELVTSTSVSPTPFARPTTGTHQLFIGSGTSAFCNYWAKAYTEIVKAIAAGGPPFERITSPAQLRNHRPDRLTTRDASLALLRRDRDAYGIRRGGAAPTLYRVPNGAFASDGNVCVVL